MEEGRQVWERCREMRGKVLESGQTGIILKVEMGGVLLVGSVEDCSDVAEEDGSERRGGRQRMLTLGMT
jgi:hypothetical protein